MPLRFTLRQLEYFVAVGEEGSIAQASDKVNVSSPSISAAVAQLEDEFGLLLFVRKHAHGLSLTHAGHRFLAQAKTVLEAANRLNQLAGEISGKVQGPLKIGCLQTLAPLILPTLRRKFEQLFPQVEISQSELHQLEIFDHLRKARIDVALTYDLDIPADIEFLPLVALPPYVLVNDMHPLSQHTSLSVDDLTDHPMVLLDLPHSAEYFLSFFDDIGTKPHIAERTRDMAVMRSMVANGFGYAIANVRALSDLSPDGQPLRCIPLTGAVRSLKLGLAMMGGAHNFLNIKAFAEYCQDSITDGSIPGMGPLR